MQNSQEYLGKNLDIDGLKINYKVAGEGPVILVLHGWGSDSARWESVQVRLAQQGFQVVIPDLPGFGKSEQPKSSWNIEDYSIFVEKFVDALSLKEFYLLGHSFGGGLALLYAVKHPEKIQKLFLFAAAIKREKSFRKDFLKIVAKVTKIFSFLPFYFLFRKAMYKYVIRTSDYSYQKGIMKDTYLKVIKQDLSPLLSKIKIPTIVLWGKKDDVISVKDAYFIKEHIADSELVIFPEGDHDIERKMPEVLVKNIVNFL